MYEKFTDRRTNANLISTRNYLFIFFPPPGLARCRPRAGRRASPGRGYTGCTRAPGGQPAPPAPPRSPPPATGHSSHSSGGSSCHVFSVTCHVSLASVSCDLPCLGCCCRGAAGPFVCWPAPAQCVSCHVMSCHVMSCHVTCSR